MAFTSGFYNSINHDRRYSNTQISMLFDGLISDGVYATIGDAFTVKAGEGMAVNIGVGRAWFNHSWTFNDADYPIVLDASDVVFDRIDAIVLEINSTETVRLNSPKYIKGVAASIPVFPALKNADGVHQYPLCYIEVGANATSIIQANIINMVGTSECPFITGILETIDTDDLIAQWQDRFEILFGEMNKAFEQAVAGELIDGSVSQVYTLTLFAENWIEDEEDVYQAVNVPGILNTDRPSVDIDLSGIPEIPDRIATDDAWSVYQVTASADTLLFRARDRADVDIPVQICCVRK